MRRKLIALDSDRPALMEVARIARSWYDVLSTVDARQAKSWLDDYSDVAVFITDHAAQQFGKISLLEHARLKFPQVTRVVITSYSDLSTLIQGLHAGTIQKLVQKPIDRNELAAAIVPFEAHAHAAVMQARPISKAG